MTVVLDAWAVLALLDGSEPAAAAIDRSAVLWTGDPELVVEGAPWSWRDLR